MDKLITLSYFVVGTLFMFYFLAIFVQKFIRNTLRLVLSVLFFTIGMLFFNLAGKMITDNDISFSWVAISNLVVLSLVGLVCVYIIYRENQRNKSNHKKPEKL